MAAEVSITLLVEAEVEDTSMPLTQIIFLLELTRLLWVLVAQVVLNLLALGLTDSHLPSDQTLLVSVVEAVNGRRRQQSQARVVLVAAAASRRLAALP